MKKSNITEILFILDLSGSMSGLEKDTIGGFNSLVEKQKNILYCAWLALSLYVQRRMFWT